ncbi:MAG: Nif3-like dinuclear metal center hexameric protein [Gemmatimonadetes bacterium]|nr:Nif3-like dinuclear metal center hexameric protein [Gemmatimonadota bacterium]
MTPIALRTITDHLDTLLGTHDTPDYAPALNGVQVEHRGPVSRIAAAVDCSERTIRAAAAAGANLLLVHHGLFWGGLRPITGPMHTRLRLLFDHDIALYASHLPLDAHETFGNSRLLAQAIGLEPTAPFARYQTIHCGVSGDCALATTALLDRVRQFSALHGGDAIASLFAAGRQTARWAICSGAGANADTMAEAAARGIDTLITGEGPHWSAVDAEERGLAIIYAGHYATETLGVQALAAHASAQFGLPWSFLPAPTGL